MTEYSDEFRAGRHVRLFRKSCTAPLERTRPFLDWSADEQSAIRSACPPEPDEVFAIAWLTRTNDWGVLTSRRIMTGSGLRIQLSEIQEVFHEQNELAAKGPGGIDRIKLKVANGSTVELTFDPGPSFWIMLSILQRFRQA
jgi:hypothetical protein